MKSFLKKLPIMLFVFALSIFCTVSANAKSIDREYEEALCLMKALGVINEEMEFDKSAPVSREDFAVYTAKLLGMDETDVESRYFVDVPSGSYGTWAINQLTVKGVFSRNAENLFYPEDNVDLNQAYKVLTTALGYDMYAVANGGYPFGYTAAAAEADIDLPMGSTADFEGIMILLYRAAQAEVYEKTIVGENIELSKNGETLLSLYHDIYFDEGTVEAVGYMTTLRDIYPGEGKIRINGNTYDLDTNIYAPDYLAAYAKYFYTDTDEELSVKVILHTADEEDIDVLIKDIESISQESITYIGENGKSKSENLNGMLWLYNGSVLGSKVSETLDNLNKGNVVLRDSDDDGSFDTVTVWDYKNFVVSGINTENSVIYNVLEAGGKLSFDEFEEVNIFDEKKNSLFFEDISLNNVLSIAASKDNKTLNIMLSTTEFNGTLSQVYGEPKTLVINDTEYELEPSYINEFENEKRLIGYVYNYKTDAFGNIAYVYDGESANPMKFGYVLKGIVTDTDEGEKVRLEILTQDTGVKKLFLAEKVKVDGVRYKEIEKLTSAFPKSGNADTEISSQMIRYELDADGNIKTVDTLILNDAYETKDNSITVVGDETFSLKWYMRNRIGMLAYANNTSTNVFSIPKKVMSDITDPLDYKVGTASSMLREDRSIYANIYTSSGRSEYVDVILRQYDYSELIKDNEVILVDKITTAVNDEGEVVKQIVGMRTGSEAVINIPNDVDLKDIGRGDLIQLRYGINDQVIPSDNQNNDDIIMLYDYSKYQGEAPTSEDWPGVTDTVTFYAAVNNAYYHNYRADTQLSYGTVVAKEGSCIWWSYKGKDSEDEMFNIAAVPIMVYDSSKRVGEQIYKGTIDDIEDTETVGLGSKIIVQTNVGIGKAVFVFK